jgi:hypothetical protein
MTHNAQMMGKKAVLLSLACISVEVSSGKATTDACSVTILSQIIMSTFTL